MVVAEEHPTPGLSAVFRTEDAALLVRAGWMAEGGDINEIGIRRMHPYTRDRLRIRESHMRPRFARVGSFVDAIALHNVAAQARLTHSDVDNIRVRFRNRDCAHR